MASLIQDDINLLNCYRYVELDPVRAGIVDLPGQFPYSSYRHIAARIHDSLITEHPCCLALASKSADRQAANRGLFAVEFDPDLLAHIRDTTNACRVMGNGRFKGQIEAMLGRSVRPAKMGRPRKRRS